MKNKKLISIIIPVRNEEKYIDSVLKSIVSYKNNNFDIEIVIIDGLSEDNTLQKIKKEFAKHKNIILLNNINKTVPYALNMGIKKSKGKIIIRMDAHSIYPKNYVQVLVSYLEKLNADNVGGMWDIIPADQSHKSKIIASLMASPFAVGNVSYRVSKSTKPIEVDSVPFGCYRREIFDKIGLFDEEFIRNQDDELNLRLKKAGGKIFLIPSLKIKYFARKNFTQLFQLYSQYGYWKPKVIKKNKKPAKLRHLVPVGFIIYLFSFPGLFFSSLFRVVWLSIFGIYTFFLIVGSFIGMKKNKLPFFDFFVFMFGFVGIHLSYGFGFLHGIFNFVIKNKKYKDFKLTR